MTEEKKVNINYKDADTLKGFISENGKTRNIYPHSILRGVQTLPEGHINYRKLESIEVDEDSIITVPFELLNNSPHIAFEIMKTEITSDEDEDSGAWF
mgnify:CR=1 FL=1